MTDRNDYHTTVIHGKSAPKPRITSNPNNVRKDTHLINSMNSASVERKIDSGDMTVPPTISLTDGQKIAQDRQNIKIDEKSMTQKQLAERANQKGGKNISVKDIQDIESGRFLMNHETNLNYLLSKKHSLNLLIG